LNPRSRFGQIGTLVAALSILGIAANGQALNTQLFVGAGNHGQAAGLFGSGAPVDSLSKTILFTGLDGSSNPQTMTMVGDTWAAAEFGVLHARTRVSLSNLYYNSGNADYWDGAHIHEDGSPDLFLSDSRASFEDTFTFSGGTDPDATVQFEYTLDGTFTQTQANIGFAFIELDYNGALSGISTNRNHTVMLMQPLPVFWDTPIPVTTTHITDFRFDLKGGQLQDPTPYTQGGSVFSDVNFYSTARLTGIFFTDSAGSPIPGITISSSSGTTYPVSTTSVPEPSALGILAGVMTTAAVAVRRRRSIGA
jgi:hypothetical protein